MARNQEKQVTRLNRLYLHKLREDELKKNPPRPKLITLNSVEEIKSWIPSIRKDIDFCLKQSQVGCYPERKIVEINDQIDHLKREHGAFVHKIRELGGDTKELPGTDRPYKERKRLHDSSGEEAPKISRYKQVDAPQEPDSDIAHVNTSRSVAIIGTVPNMALIQTPILEIDTDVSRWYGYGEESSQTSSADIIPEHQDAPLQFTQHADCATLRESKHRTMNTVKPTTIGSLKLDKSSGCCDDVCRTTVSSISKYDVNSKGSSQENPKACVFAALSNAYADSSDDEIT